MRSTLNLAPYAVSLVLGVSAMAAHASGPLLHLPEQPLAVQWQPAGKVTIAGQSYTKLSEATAQAPKVARFSALPADDGVFVGDRLLAQGSKVGPVSVSGGVVVRLAPGVNVEQVAHAHQLDIVFVGQGVALLKSQQQRDLLVLLESLGQDSKVETASLELVSGLNIPQ